MTIQIRPVETFAEYLACEDLQHAVWGPFGATPQHVLITAQKNGGLVLGAFDTAAPDAPLIGFLFGFLGRTPEGRIKHCSHMAAVLPEYRDRNIGALLKFAQRDYIAAQGIELITWTYDPLISRNARLNIGKLGAICRTYIRNVYGPDPETPDELPSDRFQVEWWITSDRVAQRLAAGAVSTTADLRATAVLLNPTPTAPLAPLIGSQLLIQIPGNIDALRAADMTTARAWRYQVRAAAEAAFAAGYAVTDYVRDGAVGLYVLERQSGRL
jgi:predicted GNAT superfamily acetyltransferase